MGPSCARGPAVAILLLAGLAAACAGPAQSESGARDASEPVGPRRGGTAVLGSISDVDSWNEYVSQQAFAGSLLRRIFLRLARDGGSGGREDAFEPLLAESWTFADDGLSLTFRLRRTAWSDGVPVTAEDVRFTWQAQTSKAVPWIGVSSKLRITDVEVIDARTVRFHFDRRYPYQFLDAVEGGILPRHVFGSVPFADWPTHDWSRYSIGSGPFVLEAHAPAQEIRLVRNPHYHVDGRPLLDRVVVRIVPDVLNLLTQLATGEIDYLEGIPPRDAYRIAADTRRGVRIAAFDYPQYDFIGWNGAEPPFDDPELRRAMTLAIDRQALVEDLLYDYGQVACTPVPSTWWGTDRSIRPLPHDAERARRILSGMGFATRGADGRRSPGRPLAFEILTNSGNQLREDVLVKLQAQLAEVGVAVQLRPLEAKAMRQEIASGRYQAYLGGWTFFGKVDLVSLFHSRSVPPRGLNVVHYRDPRVDRMLEAVESAASWSEMRSELHAFQRRFYQDQPYTLLYEKQRLVGHGRRLRGVVIDTPNDPLARLEHFWVAER